MLPLVLLHAFPLDHRMYDPLRQHLPRHVDLQTPDLPGFGVRPRSSAPPSMEAMADDVAHWWDAHGGGEAIIGGTSMGGYVTMAFLRRHPGIARAVVLLDTKASADDEGARSGRRSIADRLESENTTAALVENVYPKLIGATTKRRRPDVAAAVRDWVDATDPLSAAWAQRAMALRAESFATLDQSGLTGLVVVGDEDELTPPADADRIAQSWEQAQVVTIAEAGHLAVVERPDVVAQVLGDFLDGLA
jgi:pimeloyl-ACP methyl ester carboxylesterase